MKWATVFKAKTMEDLENLSKDDEVFENMVLTLKELNQDEKIRMQCEARADYESRLASARHAGIEMGIERERVKTEQEKQRAENAEKEIERLKKLLAKIGQE